MARGWPAWSAVLQYVVMWATATTTYIMSVKNGDEKWWLPTISNTGVLVGTGALKLTCLVGDQRPQSGIFSLGMVISSILLLFNVVSTPAHSIDGL